MTGGGPATENQDCIRNFSDVSSDPIAGLPPQIFII